ncbi:MAG: hypothetical protein V3R94_00875 [Acidobacteriota bacterium]
MKISILPIFILFVFAFVVWMTRRARHHRSITGEEARSLYSLIGALAGWTLVSTGLGLAGLHTSAWLLQTVPLLWQAVLPVVIVMTAFMFSERLRSALRGVARSTPAVWLVLIQALRIGALGGVIKGITGEITSGYVFWIGIPDFLFGLSAIAVGWLLLRGSIGPRFLVAWSLTGAAIILVPTFAFMGYWMNEPGFTFIFQFPMVLAPSIVVPMFISLNALLAWRSFRYGSQGTTVGLPGTAGAAQEGDLCYK